MAVQITRSELQKLINKNEHNELQEYEDHKRDLEAKSFAEVDKIIVKINKVLSDRTFAIRNGKIYMRINNNGIADFEVMCSIPNYLVAEYLEKKLVHYIVDKLEMNDPEEPDRYFFLLTLEPKL